MCKPGAACCTCGTATGGAGTALGVVAAFTAASVALSAAATFITDVLTAVLIAVFGMAAAVAVLLGVRLRRAHRAVPLRGPALPWMTPARALPAAPARALPVRALPAPAAHAVPGWAVTVRAGRVDPALLPGGPRGADRAHPGRGREEEAITLSVVLTTEALNAYAGPVAEQAVNQFVQVTPLPSTGSP